MVGMCVTAVGNTLTQAELASQHYHSWDSQPRLGTGLGALILVVHEAAPRGHPL